MFSLQVDQWQDAEHVIEPILTSLSESLKFVTEFRDSQGKRLDELGYVEGQQYTIDEALLYGERSVRAFKALKPNKDAPFAMNQLVNALGALRQLSDASTAFHSLANTAVLEGREVTAVSGSAINAKDTGQQVVNFLDPATRVVNSANNLCDVIPNIWTNVAASARAKNDQEFARITDHAKATATALSKAEEASREAADAAAKSKALLDEVNTAASRSQETARTNSDVLTKQIDDGSRLLTQIGEAADQAGRDTAVITTRLNDVTALKSQMDAANAAITEYSATLADTQKRVEKIENDAAGIVANGQKQSEQIEQTLADAKAMLSTATVAGLAATFNTERESLDRNMAWAQGWFFVGIVLIIISTLPLVSYVTNAPLDFKTLSINAILSNHGPNYEVTIAGVFARGVIILGPFWFTRFNASRYRSLFNLRQEYSHKYNMAYSVEGFQRQAPDFKEAIAAWVFSIVAANPTLQKEGSDMAEAPATSFADIAGDLIRRVQALFGIKAES